MLSSNQDTVKAARPIMEGVPWALSSALMQADKVKLQNSAKGAMGQLMTGLGSASRLTQHGCCSYEFMAGSHLIQYTRAQRPFANR